MMRLSYKRYLETSSTKISSSGKERDHMIKQIKVINEVEISIMAQSATSKKFKLKLNI